MSENFKPGEIAGVVVRELRKFTDSRGWLTELFRHDDLTAEFYPARLISLKPILSEI